METLMPISMSITVDYNSSRTTPTPLHPIVNRLEAFEPDTYYFRYCITKSEEFGEEEGYIPHWILYSNKIKLINLQNYEVSRTREKELPLEVVESLKTKTQEYEAKFFKAREEYIQSLVDLGYLEYVFSDYDTDTEVYMVHPNCLDQWKESYFSVDSLPTWAVKEIGLFATKDK